MVKVSVVLPTYNQSMYLRDAIQTVLGQTYQDFELIIVNDGSSDETANLLAACQHPKLRVINQVNQGLPAALNNGFAVANGEYWTWTSTDNIVASTWLEELVKALDSNSDVGYAFSHYAVIDEQGNIEYVNRDQRFDLPNLLMRHTGNASFLYRASLAKKVGSYDTALMYAEDLEMWIRMAEHTRAVYIPSVLYYYRQHAKSMTSQQHKVREATKNVVTKYLAHHGGMFDIDKLFPSIGLSANPALERWKARIWLVTLGTRATFYCPVDALVDQLQHALRENYERGLIANIVHLYVIESRWDTAAQLVSVYLQQDHSDFLIQLADIVSRRDGDSLQKIPFITIEEKFLAADCECIWTQHQLLRNLAASHKDASTDKKPPFEMIATSLVNFLEDQKDHPDVWRSIAELQTPKSKQNLHELRLYFTQLINIPQDPTALILLKTLEAVCLAYTGDLELAKNKLQLLNQLHPDLAVITGALHYITHDKIVFAS